MKVRFLPVILLAVVLVSSAPLAVRSQSISEVRAVAWSPNDTFLAVARQDGSVQILNTISQQVVLAWQADSSGPTTSVAWSPDGTRIATGGADGMAKVWNATTGQLISSQAHAGIVASVSWSPDGTKLASFDFAGEI